MLLQSKMHRNIYARIVLLEKKPLSCGCDSTWAFFVVELGALLIYTLAEFTVVTFPALCCVAAAAATFTVSPTLTLGAVVFLTLLFQSLFVFIPNGTAAELTYETIIASDGEEDEWITKALCEYVLSLTED